MEAFKVCIECEAKKPISEFPPHGRGTRGVCRVCYAAYQKHYNETRSRNSRPAKACLTCGKRVQGRDYCREHSPHYNHCKDCGRMLGRYGAHKCPAKDPKACGGCGAPIAQTIHNMRLCRPCYSAWTSQYQKAKRQEAKALIGDRCAICGYDKCQRALCLHHIDPSEKQLYSRKTGQASHTEVRRHPERFQLLCANCHAEIHEAEE
jgi:hypothetical protein